MFNDWLLFEPLLIMNVLEVISTISFMSLLLFPYQQLAWADQEILFNKSTLETLHHYTIR